MKEPYFPERKVKNKEGEVVDLFESLNESLKEQYIFAETKLNTNLKVYMGREEIPAKGTLTFKDLELLEGSILQVIIDSDSIEAIEKFYKRRGEEILAYEKFENDLINYIEEDISPKGKEVLCGKRRRNKGIWWWVNEREAVNEILGFYYYNIQAVKKYISELCRRE